MQFEAYYILHDPKLKIKFYTSWNFNWLKKYMSNCLSYLTICLINCLSTSVFFFLFHNNISVTINKFKKRITIPACFKKWENFIEYTNLNVTRRFRPKSGHLSDRVYCKLIDRTLKTLFIEASGSFLRPTIPELWRLRELWKLLVFG